MLVRTSGETASISLTLLIRASTSRFFKLGAVPDSWLIPKLLAETGLIVIRFVPNALIRVFTSALDPLPIACITITETTPIIMPSIVRKERNLFFPRALNDILTVLLIFII